VNKFVSGGIEQVCVIQINKHFPTVLPSKFGVRIIQMCVLYSNFYRVSLYVCVYVCTAAYVCLSLCCVSPESAPLSSTLIDDWRFVTGDMDASDLEAALQEMGAPHLNITDLAYSRYLSP